MASRAGAWQGTAGIFIVVAASVRLWLVILAYPAVGFGNNFDFVRQSSCIGLWQDAGNVPKLQPHLDGPLTTLVFDGDRQKTLCLASVDNIFPYLAAHMHRKHDHVDVREIGFWKALLATATLVAVASLRMCGRSRLFLLGAVALAIGDLDALSYANTLYTEFSVLLSGIAAMAACATCMARETAPGWRDVWLAVAALAWLGAGKQQYGGLAIILAALTAGTLLLRRREVARLQAGALLAAGVGASVLFNVLNSSHAGLLLFSGYANRADTFLGAVLPAARDRGLALRMVGLPASCGAVVGQTWYTMDINDPRRCPQVLHASRWRLLPLFVAQPTSLFIPLAHAVTLSQRPADNEPIRWERKSDSAELRYRLMEYTSPSFLLASLPSGAYKAVVSASIAAGLAAALLFAFRPLARSHGLAMTALGGSTLLYTLVSSVFGDGYQDLHRHAVLLPVAIAFIMVGCMCWISEQR